MNKRFKRCRKIPDWGGQMHQTRCRTVISELVYTAHEQCTGKQIGYQELRSCLLLIGHYMLI